MANKFHNKQIHPGTNATSTPPSPAVGPRSIQSLGKDGTVNWTHKNGSNIFGKAKGGFRKAKVHAVSSN